MSEIQSILNFAVARLETIELLSDHAEIVTEDKGDLTTQILKAVATLKKVAIVVAITSADTDSPNVPGPVLDVVDLVVEIAENPLLNRRGQENTDYITALTAVNEVLAALHLYRDADNNISFISKSPCFRAVEPPKGASTAYQCNFKSSGVMVAATT